MNNQVITTMATETLFAWYKLDDEVFQIRLYISSCKNLYCFFNSKLGEVRFDRKSELLHSVTRPVTVHYKHFLSAVVQQWKYQFPHYQKSEQEMERL